MLSYIWSYLKLWLVKSNSSRLRNLIISKDELDPIRLIKAAANNTAIQALRVETRQANFTQPLWNALLEVIDTNQTIQALDFSFVGLNDEDIKKLAPYLKKNQNLIKLNLKENEITAIGATALADILTDINNLQKLVLSGNPLGKGFNNIFQALQENVHLTSLIISDKWQFNGIDDSHVDALTEMVTFNGTLKQLNLCGHQFSDQGIQKLCQGLLMNSSLRAVNLDSASIDDNGFLAIGEWIKRTSSLQSLSIGAEIVQQDSITEVGLTGFLSALQSNISIKHLSISFKKDSDRLAVEIAKVLETNHTLERIILKNFPHAMKQKGVEALVRALKINTSVYEIAEGEIVKMKSLSGQVKPETVNELQRLLTRNKLIKAIKENSSALPKLTKNTSHLLLDDVFFATVIKSLSEPELIEHEKLLTDLMQKDRGRLTALKRWLGIKPGSTNIQNVLSLLAQQAQAGDAKCQMALGYIYKNQLFNKALDPAQAKSCFELATTSKDKDIAANAHFEVGHIHFIYTHDLQRAIRHFDKASERSNYTTNQDTGEQASRLRDHALGILNKDHTPILHDEQERKAQLNNFRQRQEFISSIENFFASLNKTPLKTELLPSSIQANQATSLKQSDNLLPEESNNNLILTRRTLKSPRFNS